MNLITWPGLDAHTISKHLPHSIATLKGHLNQGQKHLQSMKIKIEQDDGNYFPAVETNNTTTHHDCCTIIEPFNKTHKVYTNLTGQFPFTSSHSYKYLLIVYNQDNNAILVKPLKNHQAGKIKKA